MEKVTLRSIVDFYIGGGWGKDFPQDTHVSSAYVIRGTDFDKIKIEPTLRVPHRFHTPSNLRSRRLNIGDIVFEVSGGSKDQPVGRCILMTDELLNSFNDDVIPASFCKKITPKQSLVFPYYFFAHLQHVWNTREIIQWQVQSTGLSNFNFESFLDDYKIPLPPLPIQRRIAGILSAYDDLIENNQRRIAILERMARALYREWFVHFRYPGHEGVPLVASPLGEIPQGWEVKRLGDVCSRITDGSHSSPKSIENGYPMASVKDMHDWGINIEGCRRIASHDYEELVRNDCKPLKNDVLIAKDGSYLKHTFVVGEEEDLVILSSIAMLRPNETIRPNYLCSVLQDSATKARMRGIVSGVAIPRIVLKDFRKFQILVPSGPVQDEWAQIVDPLVESCRKLVTQIDNLRRTRDLLLPRLLSGQLDVGELDDA
jgi:type I restriction enzyme S subunit